MNEIDLSMKKSILLVGAGGHACSCIDVVEQEGKYSVSGLIGLPHEVGSFVMGYPVLGTDFDVQDLLLRCSKALITVGQIKSPDTRMKLYAKLDAAGFELPVIVSPLAYVSVHAQLGSGTVVMPGAVVNAGARIGRNCIINSHALVEHGALVSDHCHIATAAVINGDVTIGMGTFIGSNACVSQGVRIAERCVVGMGQLVLRDCIAGSYLPSANNKS